MAQDRKEFLDEIRIRKVIRNAVGVVLERREENKKEKFLQERRLRKVVRHLLKETATPDNDPTPHSSTGINVLEDLLKKVIPIIEIDFKKLTSNSEQRASFRAHMVQAVEDTLAPQIATADIGSEASKMLSLREEELDIEVGADEKFIDIEDKPKEEERPEDPREEFGLDGHDETGRNMAFESFKKIENGVSDAYDLLSSDEDREIFYDYLITNLKLYFDKFENDMGVVSEPTTSEYEAEGAPAPAPEPPSSLGL